MGGFGGPNKRPQPHEADVHNSRKARVSVEENPETLAKYKALLEENRTLDAHTIGYAMMLDKKHASQHAYLARLQAEYESLQKDRNFVAERFVKMFAELRELRELTYTQPGKALTHQQRCLQLQLNECALETHQGLL